MSLFRRGRQSAIYFTGDLHGDRKRLEDKNVRALGRGDILAVCGDFGFLWDGSPAEKKMLDWIGSRKYQVVFVEGTHDNLDLLDRYPVEEWNGGLTHHITGGLRHLIRGQAYRIGDRTLFALGGGASDDFAQRERGVNWWPQEMPGEEELKEYQSVLEGLGRQVDYVLSHQAPTNVDACITRRVCEVNYLTAFMDWVQRECTFRNWYFGSYHQNKVIPPYYHCLFDQVVRGE